MLVVPPTPASETVSLLKELSMPRSARLARRLARRYLPHRVRAAGLELIGRSGAKPAPSKPATKKVATKKAATKKAATARKRPGRPTSPTPSQPAAGAALVAALRQGVPFEQAVLAETESLLATGRADLAVSLASSLQASTATREAGDLIAGLVAAARGFNALAWSLLAPLPDRLWAPHAADAFLRAGLEEDPAEALRRVAGLADEDPDWVPAASWLALIGPTFAHGDQPLAARLFEILDRRVDADLAPEQGLVVNRDWLRSWVHRTGESRTAEPVPAGRVGFAVMDYGHPGRSRASANIGDHVQSLASFGHLVRHQNLRFDGPQDLVDLAAELAHRVRPELQRTDLDADVQLIQIDRDASMYADIPENTWTLAFGWFMHAIFDLTYGFPFHQNLRPIFVSFHCSKRGLLSEEAIDYLRQYAPIGCRDWTTVDVLLSVGVPAFFSGCMTTTVSTVFPDSSDRPPADAPVAYIDIPEADVPAGAPTYKHSSDSIRFRTFTANVYDAIDLLETYRRKHPALVTSRLHCYLPMRSLGTPVDFRPGNRSDPRFAGLAPITDTEFDAIRDTINDRLATVLTAIFGGAPTDEVYALWRDLNAADVAAAEARRAAQHPMPAARSSLAAEIAHRVGRATGDDWASDAVHVAVRVPKAGLDAGSEATTVMLRSLAEHASRPVHAWLVTRSETGLDLSGLRAAVPGVTFGIVSTKGLGADLRRGDGRTPSDADVDLLVLPELVPGVDRIVLLPYDAVVTADITELADLDLGGRLLAAPTVVAARSRSGFGLMHAAGNRLRDKTVPAAELRRRAHARHRFDFDAFDTDVLVLDAALWRARGLVETYVPYIEEFGLSTRDILHFEVGPDRVVLPARWHVVPTRSAESDPALVHWAGSVKPWSADAAPDQQRWWDERATVVL